MTDFTDGRPLNSVEKAYLRELVGQIAQYPVKRLRIDLTHSFELVGWQGRTMATALVTAGAMDWSLLEVQFESHEGQHVNHPEINRSFRRAILQRVARRRGKERTVTIPNPIRPRRMLEL